MRNCDVFPVGHYRIRPRLVCLSGDKESAGLIAAADLATEDAA
jgi:hypothetical protein